MPAFPTPVRVLARAPRYRLARRGLGKPPAPFTLTYSVTAACQSQCRTCRIGERYLRDPRRALRDLTLAETEAFFRTLGPVEFFNVSGGEPYLRKDLPQIVELACRFLRPTIIHIPTNAILAHRIPLVTEEILAVIARERPGTPLTVKPSIDGVGKKHDYVRGNPGNFRRLERTLAGLQQLAARHPNLHLELGTVISRHNMNDLQEIAEFVRAAGVQSYRNEIAETRAEFFNRSDSITPDAVTYARLVKTFSENIVAGIAHKRALTRAMEALRLTYYDLAVRVLREERQVIPCFGGITNVHVNFDGEVWPCCVLGYDKPLGNLRQVGMDFGAVWHSDQATRVRSGIARGECACPLANQMYSNILLSPASLARAAGHLARLELVRARKLTAEAIHGPQSTNR